MTKILIVEDNAKSRYMLERLLESKGHHITAAENGEDALRLARQDPPEVIISDIMMPVMNGFKLCCEVKKDSRLRHIPFIFYTATFVDESDKKLALSLGASRFVIKPAEGDQFIQILDDVLKEHRQGVLPVPDDPLNDHNILLEMYDHTLARKLAETVEKLQHERRALIRSQQQLKEAQELAHIGHWKLDLKSNSLEWSDEIYRILGLKPKEIDPSYEAFIQSVHPDDRGYVGKIHKESLSKKVPCDIEYRLVLKDGTAKYVNEKFQTLYNDEGMPTCSMGTVQDITERKEAAEGLKEANDIINKSSSVAFTWKNQEGWPVAFVSENVERLFGYTAEEFMTGDVDYAGCVHPEDLERVTKEVAEFSSKAETTEFVHEPYRIMAKDGSEKVINDWTYIVRDREGRITHYKGIVEDITDRKEAAEALRESEEKYRNILESMEEGYYEVDLAGNFTFLNDAMCKIRGYTRDELMGMNNRKYMDTETAKKVYKAFNEVYRTQKSIKGYEWKIMRRDGTEGNVEVSVSLIKDLKGKSIGFRGIALDINERKQAEKEKTKLEGQLQQAQKMEAIGTLAGGIAHDFNNILSGIMGYAELAKMKAPEGSKVIADLDKLIKSSERAAALIKQILTISRHHKKEQRPVQVRYIVNEALNLLKATLPTTIEIREDLAKDAGIVNADPTQMHQVIMNLGTNAGHAMQEGGGVLEVSLANVELDDLSVSKHLDLDAGFYLRLTVSDTGYGMTSEIMERIFDPYFTTKDTGEGTGLGLSVAQGIVEAHGGTITVYSEMGNGTTFHVYLPVILEEEREEEESEGPLPTGSERILFIDDEQVLIEIASQMLEQLRYEVVTTRSSVQALELFRAEPDRFDLVITDMTMPRMTGDKLAQELIKIRPDIPVILCTGHSRLVSEEKAKDMGIWAFVMKPISIRAMAETVRRVLDAGRSEV